jgi:hypothetical protein
MVILSMMGILVMDVIYKSTYNRNPYENWLMSFPYGKTSLTMAQSGTILGSSKKKRHAVSFTAKKIMGPLSPQVNVVTPLCLERPFKNNTQPFRFGCRQTLVIIDQGGVCVMWQNVGGWLFFGEPSMARYAAPPPHSKVLLACSMTVSIPGISCQS